MRVPVYGERQVSLRPDLQQGINVRASASAFGADIGAGLQQVGRGLGEASDAMARLRANPPSTLLGEPVTVTDLSAGSEALPPTDAVELTGPSLHVVARPSGTEPVVRIFAEAATEAEARALVERVNSAI